MERFDRFDEAIAEQLQTPLTDLEQDEGAYGGARDAVAMNVPSKAT